MKRNKKWIGIGLIVLLLGGGITCYKKVNLSDPYHLEVIQGEDSIGYGYQIYKGERVIIAQPFIPAVTEKDFPDRTGCPACRRLSTGTDQNGTGFYRVERRFERFGHYTLVPPYWHTCATPLAHLCHRAGTVVPMRWHGLFSRCLDWSILQLSVIRFLFLSL